MSISTIIFSKDRPAQLDLCLRSLPVLNHVVVIYTASTENYFRGYESCREENGWAEFKEEVDFEKDVRYALDGCNDHLMFLVDDGLFYRDLDEVDGLSPTEILDEHQDVLCVSLRLGQNTGYCYPLRRLQGLPVFKDRIGDVLFWDWRTGDADFGYPGSLDAHVWRTDDVRRMLLGTSFRGPNNLEETLVVACRGATLPTMACYERSFWVSVPVNRVNETHVNRYGETHNLPEVLLNKEYLEGKRLSLTSVVADKVTAAHCEMNLKWYD